MKRLLIILTLFAVILLAGCTQSGTNDKINIVCTIFPQYDWVRQIIGEQGDNFDLTLLLNSRIDLHNYQPSVDDIVKISACDLFIYVGGESDEWVDGVLEHATNPDMIVINLLEILGDDALIEEDGDEEDEHAWLSLRHAQMFCTAIADALSSLGFETADNLIAYIDKLKSLDAEYNTAITVASVKTLLFGDRFPFRYLAEDYGLNYYAAFAGCSAETEASFETIIFLANKADEFNLKTVMVTESSDQAIAKTIINNTAAKNQQILVLDAMQSVTSNDVKNGTTYLSIMENNLNVLKKALR
ncbi:MAG: metal ABC transporter substrate-binding protein [Oscillospiraceae bacterium]|nr:metal ABC transporter substrate-binding protein [Oscillospiraceae bacterium]